MHNFPDPNTWIMQTETSGRTRTICVAHLKSHIILKHFTVITYHQVIPQFHVMGTDSYSQVDKACFKTVCHLLKTWNCISLGIVHDPDFYMVPRDLSLNCSELWSYYWTRLSILKYLVPTEYPPGRKAELWQEPYTLTHSRDRTVMIEQGQPFAYRDMCWHRRANLSLLRLQRGRRVALCWVLLKYILTTVEISL